MSNFWRITEIESLPINVKKEDDFYEPNQMIEFKLNLMFNNLKGVITTTISFAI